VDWVAVIIRYISEYLFNTIVNHER
jgi:hypothetical protein